jgi:hypothetical protein
MVIDKLENACLYTGLSAKIGVGLEVLKVVVKVKIDD